MNEQDTHDVVRQAYAGAARSVAEDDRANAWADRLYDEDERSGLPAPALAAALGCANPTALADLQLGETVLDLGCGGAVDALLSARRVGPEGRVYGLDMTEEMVDLGERNRRAAGAENVQILQGRIERVPLPDRSVDVVISNCVLNLSPDKPAVLAEAHRVLRPGGRLAIADVATRGELPPAIRGSLEAWAGCVAGVLDVDELAALLAAAGFQDAGVRTLRSFGRSDLDLLDSSALRELRLDELPEELLARAEGRLVSVLLHGRRPAEPAARAVPTIGREELRDAIATGAVVPLDAQGPGWFEREHLPTAVRARPEDLAQLHQRLPAGKETAVAVYCWSDTCLASGLTAEHLVDVGYSQVRRYAGGKRDWMQAGLAVEGSEAGGSPG